MLLYHGSDIVVSQPRLIRQNRFLDLGFGFYTTINQQQAIAFANKVYKRRGEGSRIVNVYEFDEKKHLRNVLCRVLMRLMRHDHE